MRFWFRLVVALWLLPYAVRGLLLAVYVTLLLLSPELAKGVGGPPGR